MGLMGWDNNSSSYWQNWTQSSGTNVTVYPTLYSVQPQQLPPVMESPSTPLSDREWLDAQVAEVCELAEAA